MNSTIGDILFNATKLDNAGKCTIRRQMQCFNGIIVPRWPFTLTMIELSGDDDEVTITQSEIGGHAFIFILCLIYLMLGSCIITNQLIVAADIITAQKRATQLRLKAGGHKTVQLPVWSYSVAALTVQSLASAPLEIFLPLVEVFGRMFQAEQIGPSLIVGSSSFQLLLGVGLCLLNTSTRFIDKRLLNGFTFFILTSTFSLLSYLWVYLLIGQMSPGSISLWEAVIQLGFYPAIVITAWAAERRLPGKLIGSCIANRKHSTIGITPVLREETRKQQEMEGEVVCKYCPLDEWPTNQIVRRHKLALRLRALKEALPCRTDEEIEAILAIEIMKMMSNPPSLYRLQATSILCGDICYSHQLVLPFQPHNSSRKKSTGSGKRVRQIVRFTSPVIHEVFESQPSVTLIVERHVNSDQLMNTALVVTYMTVEDSAKATVCFEPCLASFMMDRGQQRATIEVKLYNGGNLGKRMTTFHVKICRARVITDEEIGIVDRLTAVNIPDDGMVATVNVVHDITCGVFGFENSEIRVAGIDEQATVKVVRRAGARCCVTVPYHIKAMSARLNLDYHLHGPAKGVLTFAAGQVAAFIEVKIADRDRSMSELETLLTIELSAPKANLDPSVSPGGYNLYADPKLEQQNLCTITICDDSRINQIVDRLLVITDFAEYLKTKSSWISQLKQAVFLTKPQWPGVQNDDIISWRLYLSLKIIATPWHCLVALCPPLHILHGWPCWLTLNGLMIFVSILIYDFASHFTCTVGTKGTVTAITILSVFWAIPNVLANRLAASIEKTADLPLCRLSATSIFTVSLGMGLAWTVGTIYRASKDETLALPPAELGFSVMVHCVFLAVWIMILLIRRLPPIKGELSGPAAVRWPTGVFFIALWSLWLIISVLEKMCVIPGFSRDT